MVQKLLQQLFIAFEGLREIFAEVGHLAGENEFARLIIIVIAVFTATAPVVFIQPSGENSLICGFGGAIGLTALAAIAFSLNHNAWWLILSIASGLWITLVAILPPNQNEDTAALFVIAVIVFISAVCCAGAMLFGQIIINLRKEKKEKALK